jgi:S-(hydroxymethyl)glutathione dehydrogenase/alcohol dehydrogenase
VKAAILTELREPLTIADVEPPAELGDGQVRVDVAFSGVCGSQLGEIDGVKGPDRWLPHLLGHEGSGVVAEVGPGVTTVAPGDRVVLHWMRGEGIESDTPAYDWGGTRVNAGWVTTFNEQAVVAENRVTQLPDGLSLELAPLLGCAIPTGFGVVHNNAGLKGGESVVVLGAGGVGLAEVHAASLAGAGPVVAVDVHQNRLELASRLGATHTLLSGDGLEERLREVVGSDGADVVLENTGNPALIELAYNLAAAQGRAILVGVPPAGSTVSIHTLPLHFGKVLTGSHGGSARPERDIPRYGRLAVDGRLKLADMVTDRYPFDAINDAIADLRSGRVAGRCLIEVGGT